MLEDFEKYNTYIVVENQDEKFGNSQRIDGDNIENILEGKFDYKKSKKN